MAVELVNLETTRAAAKKSSIEILEDLLAEAKEGRVIAVAVGFVRPGGFINSEHSYCDNIGALLGSLTLAQHRICRKLSE